MRKTVTVLIAFLLAGGLVMAQPDIPAPGMTPGDPLYSLDRASEKVELAVANAPLIGGPELAAKVRANHASERLAEARKLAERNNTEQAERLVREYDEQMNRSVGAAARSGKPEFAGRMKNVSSNHVKVLENLIRTVPEPARKGIQNAIDNSRKNQEKLGKAAGRPEDIPSQGKPAEKFEPGQNSGSQIDQGNAVPKPAENSEHDRNNPSRGPGNPGSPILP